MALKSGSQIRQILSCSKNFNDLLPGGCLVGHLKKLFDSFISSANFAFVSALCHRLLALYDEQGVQFQKQLIACNCV